MCQVDIIHKAHVSSFPQKYWGISKQANPLPIGRNSTGVRNYNGRRGRWSSNRSTICSSLDPRYAGLEHTHSRYRGNRRTAARRLLEDVNSHSAHQEESIDSVRF